MKHKLIATFPMPERSSDLNKAHWMEILQDKNFTLQSIDDEAKKRQMSNQKVYESHKKEKKLWELLEQDRKMWNPE
tara:strand:- start:171 stop:398 length:228 start_codon:yes stop_codon:yes gene_type:complete